MIRILKYFLIILFIISCSKKTPNTDAGKSIISRLEVVAVLHDEIALNRTHDIEVNNGIAYLAGKGGSLTVIDVRKPAYPQLLWHVRDADKYDEAETVMPLSPNRLLIGTRDVLLFDVTDPSSPILLSKVEERDKINLINGFARKGDIVFGCNKQGYIFAIDVSDLNTLTFKGSRETRKRGELNSPHDVAMCGDLLVVVSPQGFGGVRLEHKVLPGRLAVYQVFNSDSGKLLPSQEWKMVGLIENFRLAGANRVMTQGTRACVGSSLYFQPNMRKDELRANVSVVELAYPSQPILRGSIDFPDEQGPNGLEWVGSTAYAAGGQTVQAIDVSDPDKLRQKAVLFSPEAFPGGRDDGHDLVLVNDHLFVTAQTSHSLVVIRVAPEVKR